MPPCATCTPPRRCPALVCRLSRFTPLTTILCWSGMVRRTSPCLPLSLPAVTITGSPGARSSHRRLGCGLLRSTVLEHLRSEADDLHEVALAQLAGDRPEDARAARVVRVVDDHGSVLVEGDRGAVVAAERLARAHDDCLDDLALLDRALRSRGLDGRGDHVAHARITALRAALDPDAENLARTGVVRDAQSGFLLDH